VQGFDNWAVLASGLTIGRSLSDSVGCANPGQVKDLVVAVRGITGEEHFAGLHMHNTRAQGLANVVAGLEVGGHDLR
jgi:isopropylmalate/homocitrate/citramalate synthase